MHQMTSTDLRAGLCVCSYVPWRSVAEPLIEQKPETIYNTYHVLMCVRVACHMR